MPKDTPPRHILIDFENVPDTNLAPLAGSEAEITFLVGERNRIQNDLKKHIPADGADTVIEWLKKAKVVDVSADNKVKVMPAAARDEPD